MRLGEQRNRLSSAFLICLVCTTACAYKRPSSGGGALEARYRAFRGAPEQAAAVSTRAYRGLLARSLGAQCRMFPSDSQLYDRRARECGAVPASVLGIARLYLETAATAASVTPLLMEGRLRWLDLPPAGSCAP